MLFATVGPLQLLRSVDFFVSKNRRNLGGLSGFCATSLPKDALKARGIENEG